MSDDSSYYEEEFVSDDDVEVLDNEELVEELDSADEHEFDEITVDDDDQPLYSSEDDDGNEDGDDEESKQSFESPEPKKGSLGPPKSKRLVDELKVTLSNRVSPYPAAKVTMNEAAKAELLQMQLDGSDSDDDGDHPEDDHDDDDSDENSDYDLEGVQHSLDQETQDGDDELEHGDSHHEMESIDGNIEESSVQQSMDGNQMITSSRLDVESTDDNFSSEDQSLGGTDDEPDIGIGSSRHTPSEDLSVDKTVEDAEEVASLHDVQSNAVTENSEADMDTDSDDDDDDDDDDGDEPMVPMQGGPLPVHILDKEENDQDGLVPTIQQSFSGASGSFDEVTVDDEEIAPKEDPAAKVQAIADNVPKVDAVPPEKSLLNSIPQQKDEPAKPTKQKSIPVATIEYTPEEVPASKRKSKSMPIVVPEPEQQKPIPEPREPEESVMHDYLKTRNWQDLLKVMEKMRKQDPDTVAYELTKTEPKRKATTLHVAVATAPLALSKLLISIIPFSARRDILLQQDMNGNTPLHEACANLDVKQDNTIDPSIIKTLGLGAPEAHYVKNNDGDTPFFLLMTCPALRIMHPVDDIMLALENRGEDIVRSILQAQPDLTSVHNKRNMTLLHVAAAHGVNERVQMALLDYTSFAAELSDDTSRLPLHYLAETIGKGKPHNFFAERLLVLSPEALTCPCSTGDTPLHLFVKNIPTKTNADLLIQFTETLLGRANSDTMCPLLVKNKKGYTPLHCCAVYEVPPVVVQTLMRSPFAEKAASVTDTNRSTPAHLMCSSKIMGSLLDSIIAVTTPAVALKQDAKDRTPLHVASENQKATRQVVQALIDVNSKACKVLNDKGRLPLHVAMRKNSPEAVVKTLLKAHPKASKVVFDGENNVFHEMCQYRTQAPIIQMISQLFPEGAKAENKMLNIPLHVAAAYQCDLATVTALVEAYPEGCVRQNRLKDVPLHYAMSSKANPDVIAYLVKASPDSVSIRNKDGKTPMDKAKKCGLVEVVTKALGKAAKRNSRVDLSAKIKNAGRSNGEQGGPKISVSTKPKSMKVLSKAMESSPKSRGRDKDTASNRERKSRSKSRDGVDARSRSKSRDGALRRARSKSRDGASRRARSKSRDANTIEKESKSRDSRSVTRDGESKSKRSNSVDRSSKKDASSVIRRARRASTTEIPKTSKTPKTPGSSSKSKVDISGLLSPDSKKKKSKKTSLEDDVKSKRREMEEEGTKKSKDKSSKSLRKLKVNDDDDYLETPKKSKKKPKSLASLTKAKRESLKSSSSKFHGSDGSIDILPTEMIHLDQGLSSSKDMKSKGHVSSSGVSILSNGTLKSRRKTKEFDLKTPDTKKGKQRRSSTRKSVTIQDVMTPSSGSPGTPGSLLNEMLMSPMHMSSRFVPPVWDDEDE